MKLGLTQLSGLLLAVALVCPSLADDKAEKANKPDRQKGKDKAEQVIAGPLAAQLAKANLTDEQKQELNEIKKRYADKVAAARKAVGEAVGKDARQARAAALAKAKAEGKKGAELKAAVNEAFPLTDEQTKAVADAQVQMKQVQTDLRKELLAVLTDEQKESLGLNKPPRGKKQPKGENQRGKNKNKNAE